MKKGLKVIFVVLLSFVTLASMSSALELSIMTGGLKGTYYQFGLNLKELAKENNIELNVFNSTGSVENIYAVFKRPNTQMGIVQSDVLAFVSRVQTDPVLKRIAKKIKMVFPLYNEEIHLLGRKDISDFDGLNNKRVAIGEEGSGTYLTAKLLFEISDIKPSEMLTIGLDDALSQLKAGTIDAMFYVCGYPVKLFSENVTEEDGLALIPITDKNIVEFYPRAQIPANTYKWQKEMIETAAVKAVLVSFDFRRNNCEYVGKFAKILYDNMEWLTNSGHPKWKSVDLNYPLKGWEQYDCVKKYFSKPSQVPTPQPSQINPVLEAIKDLL